MTEGQMRESVGGGDGDDSWERNFWFGYGDYRDVAGTTGLMKLRVCLQISLQAKETTCMDTQWGIHSCMNTPVRTYPHLCTNLSFD